MDDQKFYEVYDVVRGNGRKLYLLVREGRVVNLEQMGSETSLSILKRDSAEDDDWPYHEIYSLVMFFLRKLYNDLRFRREVKLEAEAREIAKEIAQFV